MQFSKGIAQIVDDEDLEALEAFCLILDTNEAVIAAAEEEGVDLEALEELLWRIS